MASLPLYTVKVPLVTLLHSIWKCLLSPYYVSDVVLGTLGTVVDKKPMAPALTEFALWRGQTQVSKY